MCHVRTAGEDAYPSDIRLVTEELVDCLDTFAELLTEILNHCGPLTTGQKRKIREAVESWERMREIFEDA